MSPDDEEELLRSAALKNVQPILHARQRAEQELLKTKEALEAETRVLELLNKAGATIASKLDLESVAQAVTDAATELSGAELGVFFYASRVDQGTFSLFTLAGATRAAIEKLGHPRRTPTLTTTFHHEGVMRIGDVGTDPRHGEMNAQFGLPEGHPAVRSYLAVPVRARTGEVLGGLFFGHSQCDVFTERAERVIVGIAAQAATAMDNARLYEDATQAAEERSRLLAAERGARVELERVSLVKDEFLATLSHELRTPLNAVLGWADVLLSAPIDEATARRGLEAIARNARAQAELIDDLLDMNRIVSGQLRLDLQQIEIAAAIQAAIDSVRPSADAKSIAIRATIDPNAGPVSGDPHRLHQVMWNLLTNAVKFTPKAGKIDVLLQQVSSHIEITVHDTGMGISADFLPYLFERFRQEDSSTTRKHGGLGLGLSIVKQLVELHGGTVTADSPGEGKGATFVVCLPLRAVREVADATRAHPTTRSLSSVPGPEVSLAKIRVLVVDDDADARDLVELVLTQAGAEVITASSAGDGLALVQADPPDVIVSDIGMPERDGYEFIRDVRTLASTKGGSIPAIAITAFARSQDRTRAMIAGFQAHVAKPIESAELVAAIRSLARHSGGRR